MASPDEVEPREPEALPARPFDANTRRIHEHNISKNCQNRILKRNSAHVRDDGALDVSRFSARIGVFSRKGYAGPSACTPKGEKYMQPGYPQGSYVTELRVQRELSKLTEGTNLARSPDFNQSNVKWD